MNTLTRIKLFLCKLIFRDGESECRDRYRDCESKPEAIREMHQAKEVELNYRKGDGLADK